MNGPQPITILIAALGGEGGGVLTDWIVEAAIHEGFPVQSTSIPGVAQRTGATTYYVEIFPERIDDPRRRPVFGLYPSPGYVDVMICSELLEAGRAMEGGYVSPGRTTLIAATHRIYSVAEKAAMADGRYEAKRIVAAANELAKQPLLADYAGLARREGTVVNAILLGALAGSGRLPIPATRFEDAIRAGGIAVENNLKGFAAGRASVETGAVEHPDSESPSPIRPRRAAHKVEALLKRVDVTFPPPLHDILRSGVMRLLDYQDARYATVYLDRLDNIALVDDSSKDFALTRSVARHLALWMAYEDVIRVADLKSRRTRFERVRQEVGAKNGEPVRLTEFLKPGPDEIAAILPPAMGRRLLGWAQAHGGVQRWQRSLRTRTDTVFGFSRLWLLARLRLVRRRTLRFVEEQASIDDWLKTVIAATAVDYDFGREVAESAHILKGYGDTHLRGRSNFSTIMDRLVKPALSGAGRRSAMAAKIKAARDAALADPEGFAIAKILAANAESTLGETASFNDQNKGGKAA